MAGPRRVSEGGLAEHWWVDEHGQQRYEARRTFTCCHCGSVFFYPGKDEPAAGFCSSCFAPECLPCGHRLNGRCAAFIRQVEEHEKRMAGRRANEELLRAGGVFFPPSPGPG